MRHPELVMQNNRLRQSQSTLHVNCMLRVSACWVVAQKTDTVAPRPSPNWDSCSRSRAAVDGSAKSEFSPALAIII
ncbi:hypothetical protein CPB85DRAFT_1284930, partial [Mucidula mucida]